MYNINITICGRPITMCLSSAEYASPVWSRSSHASKIDPVLKAACRAISECLRPTRVDDLYLLRGIGPTYQMGSLIPGWETQTRKWPSASSLSGISSQRDTHIKTQLPPNAEPLDGSTRTRRLILWSSHIQTTPQKLYCSPKESLPPCSSETRHTWSSLTHLRTGTGRWKFVMQKWGFN